MARPDSGFDAALLRQKTFIRHVEIHDVLGSTNDRAATLARELPTDELPALVVARQQTAGRGRGRNVWWSAEGALAFSVLLETSRWGLAQRDWPQVSLAIAAAVADAIRMRIADCGRRITKSDGEHSSPSPQSPAPSLPLPVVTVKAPNDVLISGRKVCGILLESPGGAAPAKDRLIVGIGVNVNNSWSAATADVAARGIALCDVTGRQHDLSCILINLLCTMESRLNER